MTDADKLVERFPEINLVNYDHDDVVALNEWGIEAADWIEAHSRKQPATAGSMFSTEASHLMGEASGGQSAAAPVLTYEREGGKWLKDSTFDERSFPDDAPLENGIYYNDCAHCGRSFTGYKRRVLCRVCDAARSSGQERKG